MDFQRETIAATHLELAPLVRAHVEEVGAWDVEKFSFDLEKYVQLETLGIAVLHTARLSAQPDGVNGELVGYSLFHVMKHQHFSETMAMQDAVYVAPGHRGYGAARFMVWVDAQLKGLGATSIMRNSQAKKPHNRTLERLGYDLHESSYLKRF